MHICQHPKGVLECAAKKSTFLEELKKRVLVFDDAIGTNLQARESTREIIKY